MAEEGGGAKAEGMISEQRKAELEAIKLRTQEEAAKAAEASKKEGKKKMGWVPMRVLQPAGRGLAVLSWR